MAFKIMAFKIPAKLAKEIEEKTQAALDALEELAELLAERVVEPMQEAYDEKSEKWQDGDRGSATLTWIDSLREYHDVIQTMVDDWPEMISPEPEY